jgi:tryptophanyl-tRNA synthetase
MAALAADPGQPDREHHGPPPGTVCLHFRGSAGQGFGAFMPALADALIAKLAPLRARLEQFRADPTELDRILAAGAERAAALGAPTLVDAYRAVGLSR